MSATAQPLKFANRYVLLEKETYDRVSSATVSDRNTTTTVRDDPLLEDGALSDIKRGLAELRATTSTQLETSPLRTELLTTIIYDGAISWTWNAKRNSGEDTLRAAFSITPPVSRVE